MAEELRLALAMRGGVSLAVWIGGAVAEIEQFRAAAGKPARRDPGNGDAPGPAGEGSAQAPADAADSASPDEGAPATAGAGSWKTWLDLRGFHKVTVDILAGASAGGLNGVLYAASQVYGFDFAAMRDIWLDLGSTESLVRRMPPYPSLFMGDDFFERSLYERLGGLVEGSSTANRNAPEIDLSLSATYVKPLVRPVPTPGDQPLTERRFASDFHFRQPSKRMLWTGSDFPPRAADSPDLQWALRRMALAARTTSSFPGAFEGAAMTSLRVSNFTAASTEQCVPPRPGDTPGDMKSLPDMGGLLRDRSGRAPVADAAVRDGDVFVAADGGILDNIPIGRALDAIARAPADGVTRRLLIYLQPGATSVAKPPSADPPTLEARRDTISVLTGMAKTRLADETINADIEALERHNDAVQRARSTRKGTFADLYDPAGLIARSATVAAGYRTSRALDDARRIFDLLSDPIEKLGHDPFPCGIGLAPVANNADEMFVSPPSEVQLIADDVWRSPMAGWPASTRQSLQAHLATQFAKAPSSDAQQIVAPVPPQSLAIGVKPLLRITQLLIEWARYREAISPVGDADDELREKVSPAKRTLYQLAEFLERALDRPRDLVWVAGAARMQGSAARTYDERTRKFVDRMYLLSAGDVAKTIAALPAGDGDSLAEVTARNHARIDTVWGEPVDAVEGADGLEDIRPRLVKDVLVPQLVAIRSAPIDPARQKVQEGSPAAALDHVLAPPAPAADDAAVLAALEVVTYPEFAYGLPGRRRIHFVRMSSENRTPLAPGFKRILEVAKTDMLWWDPKKPLPADQEGIHVNLKLAGNELANFSAFLLPEWRSNDWLWGRLDAVPTLVDEIIDVDAVAALLAASPQTSAIDAAVKFLLPDDHPWATIFGREKFEARRDLLRGQLLDVQNFVVAAAAAAATPRTADPPSDDVERPSISYIRDSVIALRQFDILRGEMAMSWKPGGRPAGSPPSPAPPPLDATATFHEMAVRLFGAEKLTDNAHRPELRDRFSELAEALGNTLVDNVNTSHPGGVTLGKRAIKFVTWVIHIISGFIVRKLLTPKAKSHPVKTWMIASGLAFVAAAGVVGFVRNRAAFIIGAAIGLSTVAGVGLWVRSRIRRALKDITFVSKTTPPKSGSKRT